jgi:ubiquinone/menaquinone biosynthesis C-methylase UbiE
MNTPLEKSYGKMKNQLFAHLDGEVLEIGPGAGVNFGHYPKSVRVRGVEPNPYMHPYLEQAAEEAGLAFEIDGGHAEELHAADGSVDHVVSTLVLCSVFDMDRVLAEILRVLKPGGTFVFIEHVAGPRGSVVRRVQDFVRPAWVKVGDGCNPNRETWGHIESAGFSDVHLEHRSIKTPFVIVNPHILGKAVK